MTREETLQIMTVLKTAYPNFYKGMGRKEAESTVSLWHDMFADDDPVHVAAAVKALIAMDAKGFPPHIGAVKDKLAKITMPQEMTELEAWGIVYKAICRGSLYDSKGEYEKLPPLLKRLVGSPNQLREWAMMDADVVQSVVSSNFQRSYRACSASEREFALMPPDVKSLISGFADALSIGALPE